MDIYYFSQFLWVRNLGAVWLGGLDWRLICSFRFWLEQQSPEGLAGAGGSVSKTAQSHGGTFVLAFVGGFGSFSHTLLHRTACALLTWQAASSRTRNSGDQGGRCKCLL